MEGEDKESDHKDAFGKKSAPKRILVLVSGAICNLLLGVIICFIISVSSDNGFISAKVQGFHKDSSSAAVLKKGDIIRKVNGRRIFVVNDISHEMVSADNPVMSMEVERGGKNILLDNVVFNSHVNESGKNSIEIDFYLERQEKTFITVMQQTFGSFVSNVRLIWVTLGDLLTGKYGLNDLSGPVGISSVVGEVIEQSIGYGILEAFRSVMFLAGIITINVGIFNLLPFPALDGFRIATVAVEGVTKKKMTPAIEAAVNGVGFIILIGVMLIVCFSDIYKLFGA